MGFPSCETGTFGVYNSIISSHRCNHHDEAIQAYDKAIQLDPKFARAWYYKGSSLSNLDRYDKAMEAYDKAIELDPKYAWAWNDNGNCSCSTGQV